MQISEKYAAKIRGLTERLEEMLKAQTGFSKEFHIDADWKAIIEKYFNRRKLTREMAEAFVEKVIVYEDGKLEVDLVYDDMLNELLDLSAERGGING